MKQELTEDEKAAFEAWKTHAKERADDKWLATSIGQMVEVYCNRAPKVTGKVVAFDGRYGKVLIECADGEPDYRVEISLSNIVQVRFRKP